ncbi:2-oxo-4-hydroxy-4-carboxy-5-ureidoimidazoline decarboxylase [Catellatospora tritici]|uniref:2-oxo-4-hydroxy-4-carboxy-5-ureidoimidazoline decarboxylase n=1 Tax=Catellatospora tritici TaxID=2851566 RepID=UPI001C2DD2D8|nr:2-oxo-4-hydroxy-4-carboxy-5-ureidoimidazoline decarboxylase [Catellatospora tritici]MBV1854712.1 2-oxo-4-hydroxy-4-carboxy-5-ureidoimidazoline decarboxylase [Catellatospora tritici]
MSTAAFNELPAPRAEAELLACCASPAWAAQVTAGRPYPDEDALVAAGEVALDGLDWAEIERALAAHPRIGERARGDSREAAWSRREQSGAADADATTAQALVAANRAYEERFGHVFLIFASGRSAEQMLAAARARLEHDALAEREVVRRELSAITVHRLRKLMSS